jgi:zinc transport system substrate-binding protein
MTFLRILPVLIFCLAPVRPAQALTIVTDIAPVRAIVQAVAGPGADVTALIRPALSPHDFSMRPSDARLLASADLVVWLGPDSTPGLAHALEADTSPRVLALNGVTGTQRLELRGVGVFGTGSGAGHDDDHDHDHADPHTWLDPENAALWAGAIAERLAELDAAGADTYRAHARELVRAIAEVRNMIERDLAGQPPVPFAQFHDAFHHFELRFALAPLGAATSEDEESLSLGVIADLRGALEGAAPACLFTSNEAVADRARALLEIIGVTPGYLDALGRDLPEGFTYPDLLRAIADGYLGCFRAAAR